MSQNAESQNAKQCRISDSISVGGSSALLLIAGPCQIESRDHALMMAAKLKEMTSGLPLNLVFKSSYDKANRTSLKGERGIGMERGLKILQEVKSSLSIPILTDIHDVAQAKIAGEIVDVLQTPAFLCRQTDLLEAAGASGKAVNVKKGQFLAPEDMKFVAEKVSKGGNSNVMLCERGSSFGYRDLVVDMRGLVIMKETGYPVIFDATHSVQSMGGAGGKSGGSRKFVLPLLRAAIGVGVDGVFIECHDDPDKAPSDGPSMIKLDDMPQLLKDICELHAKVQSLKSNVN